jgi:hypothetical protein
MNELCTTFAKPQFIWESCAQANVLKVRRRASKVFARDKQVYAGDLAIVPYDLVISLATAITKHAEQAR